jgi:hypothetical protein
LKVIDRKRDKRICHHLGNYDNLQFFWDIWNIKKKSRNVDILNWYWLCDFRLNLMIVVKKTNGYSHEWVDKVRRMKRKRYISSVKTCLNNNDIRCYNWKNTSKAFFFLHNLTKWQEIHWSFFSSQFIHSCCCWLKIRRKSKDLFTKKLLLCKNIYE